MNRGRVTNGCLTPYFLLENLQFVFFVAHVRPELDALQRDLVLCGFHGVHGDLEWQSSAARRTADESLTAKSAGPM